MHDPVLLSVAFIFGICFGSFLNVLIYRLPLEKSLIKPGSHCPKCNTPIKFYDNIPVLSYLILGAKCRKCKAPISIRYPLVEALAGALVVLAFFHFGFTVKGFEAALLSLLFIAIFFIDLEHYIIPDSLDLPWILIGLGISIIPGALVGWLDSLIGIVVGGGVFFLVMWLGEKVFKKEAMGFGDVKFAAMLGAFIGWKYLLLVFVLASFIGSVVGVTLILISRRRDKSTYVPFGPFLVVAALTTIYFGDEIINAYLVFVHIR
jgi:leader peptidase (prepilin peptidase) / N-methyltransferase